MEILRESAVKKDCLNNKMVTVIGYGSQGRAQALCLKDSGIDVVIGLREKSPSRETAEKDGLEVLSIKDAVRAGDIVHILIPDEKQADVLESEIFPNWTEGKTLSFSHGFSIYFGSIKIPSATDVILVAPKGPGTEVRKTYLDGFGVPGLIAVKKDYTGNAEDTALALANGMGLTRAGVLKTNFREEACEDLFGEQAVLCGGLFYLMKAGFEVLTEAGYTSEIAYFETVHEMKLIVDLIYEGGVGKMAEVISNTAEWGMYDSGPVIITQDVKERMRKVLKSVEDGSFAKKWMNEYRAGSPQLSKKREELKKHEIEKTGKSIREQFSK